MKYVDDFRRKDLAKLLAGEMARIAKPDQRYNIMEFCGGHTHAIFRYGVQDLVPDNVRYIHGPGCPVCVLPIPRIDHAIGLASRCGVILCAYGDVMRVPGSRKSSLIRARAGGADVRMVYSTEDALRVARDNPEREVVFFAIGFETTTPATAVAILRAREAGLTNFSVFCNHVLTPAAITHIMTAADAKVPENGAIGGANIDGFLGPSHVSSVIGSAPYEFVPREYGKPVVIAGFEPLDVMQSTLMLIRQINEGRAEVENQYRRVVTPKGNAKAQALVAEVFETRAAFEWRGLGAVPQSALQIRDSFADFDAEKRFDVRDSGGRDVKGCECPAILRGVKRPLDCRLFGTICTPDNPQGACMVSSEGILRGLLGYGRFRGAGRKVAGGAGAGAGAGGRAARGGRDTPIPGEAA